MLRSFVYSLTAWRSPAAPARWSISALSEGDGLTTLFHSTTKTAARRGRTALAFQRTAVLDSRLLGAG
jgi:hypothetical protein